MSLIAKTRESTTLQILLVPLSLLCWKFFQLDIENTGQFAQAAQGFAMAIGMLMAIWLGRETKESYFKHKTDV